jgi:cbb3-type cytochrome oxidase subunit 3
MMDINLIRIFVTVCAFAAFLAIVWWAYAPSRKAAWEQKAILEGDEE